MSGEWDGLRAAAEAATPGGWVTSGPDLCLIAPNEWSSWGLAYVTRSPADATYIAAASPDVVLGLLDRLAEVEGQVERTEQQIHEPGGFIDQVSAAEQALSDLRHAVDPRCPFHGHHPAITYTSTTRCLCPQKPVTAPLSASGAESDHGGRRDGEGMA